MYNNDKYPTSDLQYLNGHTVANISDVLPLREKLSFNATYLASHMLGDRYSELWLSHFKLAYQERIKKLLGEHRKNLGAQRKCVPVAELSDISPEDLFTHHAATGIPLVLKGLAGNWSAVKKWDFDFFREHYGDDPAILVNSRQLDHKYKGNQTESIEETDIRGVIDNILQGGTQYARFHPLLDRHPELMVDLDMTWIAQHMIGNNARMRPFHKIFIGGKGRTTAAHAERVENLFLQVEGEKLWTMWPADYNYVCDSDSNRAIYKTSSLNPADPDFERFPGYQYVDYYETVLEPGDMLYVPGYTWHQVTNLSHSIGCGVRWMSPQTSFKHDPLKAIMALFSTNPSIFRWKEFIEAGGVFDFNRMIKLRVSNSNR